MYQEGNCIQGVCGGGSRGGAQDAATHSHLLLLLLPQVAGGKGSRLPGAKPLWVQGDSLLLALDCRRHEGAAAVPRLTLTNMTTGCVAASQVKPLSPESPKPPNPNVVGLWPPARYVARCS